jgi:drug/metabolite transporter (DMT)-like permease
MLKMKVASTAFSAGLLLFASQTAIGASGIFARFALSGTGPVMVSALRLTIASAILIAVHLRSDRQAVSRRHEQLFCFCGIALAAHFATWMASLCYVSVATATLIISTAPLWTTLYDLVVLKNRPSLKFWCGFLLAGLGTFLIVTGNTAGGASHNLAVHNFGAELFGEMLAAIGGIAFAFYLIVIRSITHTYSTLTIITRTYSWSAVFLWLAAIGFGESMPGTNIQSWSGIFAMALIAQLFGHTCLNASLKTFAPRIVALTTLLEPVIAGVLASIIFGEILSTQMIIGAVLLLGALALVMASSRTEEKVEEVKVMVEV